MRAMVTPQLEERTFEERDVERPRPEAGEVLVRVVAAGTNPVDAKLRANGSSAGLEAPIILGADISGVVEEVGPGVTDLARVRRFTTHLRSSVRARTVATPSTTSRRLTSWPRSQPRSHTRKQRPCRSPEGRPTRR